MKRFSGALVVLVPILLTLVAGCTQGVVKDESMSKGTSEANSSDQKAMRGVALQTNGSDNGSSDMTKRMLADAAKIPRAIVKTGKGEVVIVFKASSIFSGRDKIHTRGKAALNEVANYLKKYPTEAVRIRCYSDNAGKVEMQKALTDMRARKVKDYLVYLQNVSADRIVTKGLGSVEPIADNGTVSGRALNRRIEIGIAISQ